MYETSSARRGGLYPSQFSIKNEGRYGHVSYNPNHCDFPDIHSTAVKHRCVFLVA